MGDIDEVSGFFPCFFVFILEDIFFFLIFEIMIQD